MLKLLGTLLLAALLTGCLPIGIRGSSLPYAAQERPPQPITTATA